MRHGQASFGSTNYDCLSDLGRQQSRWLGEYFTGRGITFARVFAGRLIRQHDTAREILAGMDTVPDRLETWPVFAGRVRGALDDACADVARGDAVLAVTSGGVIETQDSLRGKTGKKAFGWRVADRVPNESRNWGQRKGCVTLKFACQQN